jgi:hypothetical protein
MTLKYLFTVEYQDGTIHKQTPADKSTIENNRSEFFDVLNSGKKLKSFMLKEQALFRPKWIKVDLTNGQFTQSSNANPVFEGDSQTPDVKDVELIFYRQHEHDFIRGTNKESAHRVTYYLGWQTNIDGKNYKQIKGLI